MRSSMYDGEALVQPEVAPRRVGHEVARPRVRQLVRHHRHERVVAGQHRRRQEREARVLHAAVRERRRQHEHVVAAPAIRPVQRLGGRRASSRGRRTPSPRPIDHGRLGVDGRARPDSRRAMSPIASAIRYDGIGCVIRKRNARPPVGRSGRPASAARRSSPRAAPSGTVMRASYVWRTPGCPAWESTSASGSPVLARTGTGVAFPAVCAGCSHCSAPASGEVR